MLYHKIFSHSTSSEWVVLIHGAGGSSSIWFKQLRDYIAHFNVLLLDLRGHGKSSEVFTDRRYSFNDVSRDVVDLLNHLHVRQAHFVGISLGTLIIRTIAELDADKVKTMILGGAITRMDLRSRVLLWLAKVSKPIIPFIWIYQICAHILMPTRRNRESRSLFISDALKMRQSEFLRWFTLTASLNPLLRYFREKDLGLPTLYLMGDEDYMFLPQVRNLVKFHKNALLHVIDNCGHVCNVEQPEEFNRHSVAFIYQNS
ncbi:MAG: alpha/beta hydrolase [Bernardetiaceae bacterium]|jgi:pimeloyl-ACP methyl ester carboxylesterase|nr:alpha/beta hydrolase [Bernardetiaceae bacterium]